MVPEGWEKLKAKEVFYSFSKKNHPDEELLSATQDFGVLPRSMLLARVTMPTKNLETFKLVEEGDFVISLRSFQGGIEYSQYRGIVSPAYTVLKNKVEISSKFFRHYFKTSKFINDLDSSVIGIRDGKQISYKDFAEIYLPYPPLPEQKKIAAILSSVDDAIQARQSVIDQTHRVKQGLMQQLFTRGIGHTRFKQSEIGEIPEEWEVMTVNEIVSLMKSGLSRRILPQDIGIPVLISGNIQNGKLDTKELKFWYEKDPQGARVDDYILKDGDILLCFINSLSQIGKLCLYEDIGRSAIYTTNLFRIQLKQLYSPNFGYYIFSAPFFQKEIDLITKPAVNQASFTKTDFLRILIPIPPKEEREKIVKILESVNYSLETAQIQLRTIQKLKHGLMQDLLTGRVRVKLDGEATT